MEVMLLSYLEADYTKLPFEMEWQTVHIMKWGLILQGSLQKFQTKASGMVLETKCMTTQAIETK